MARSCEERSCNDSDFSRIEGLIKGNTFSSEEIGRLLEILNSKTVDALTQQQVENSDGKDTQMVLRTEKVHDISSLEKQQEISQASKGPAQVDASPIDIARAYMASCASGGNDRHKFMSKYEQAPSSKLPSGKAFSPTSSSKPLICWPGVVLHDCSTPQDQKSKSIHEFSRSSYSRSVLSKSTSKFPVDGRYENLSSPFQKSQTSSYKKENASVDTVGTYGSVGPIRRVRSKFASEYRPRLSIFSSSEKQISSRIMDPLASEGSLSVKRKNLQPREALGATVYLGESAPVNSDINYSETKSSSSRAVRTILEHLDREKPTPKEKEAEIQLTTSWRRSSVFQPNNAGQVGNGSTLHIREPTLDLDSNKHGRKGMSAKSRFANDISETKDAAKGKAIASEADPSASGLLQGAVADPCFTSTSGSSALNKISTEATTNSIFPNPRRNAQGTRTAADTELPKNNGMQKISLPSLAINKPEFSSASGGSYPTFTFPVPASSVFSDLPTPVFPSSSSSAASVPSTPTYTFRKSSTPRLIFSFPSTSSPTKTQDDLDPKFTFGSENNARLSFASFGGKNAVCY